MNHKGQQPVVSLSYEKGFFAKVTLLIIQVTPEWGVVEKFKFKTEIEQ